MSVREKLQKTSKSNLRITSPHVDPLSVVTDGQIVEEAGRDVGHLVVDALQVKRPLEVESDRTRPLLVLAVSQLTEKAAAEHPNTSGI